jgi:hypothetical protein
VIFTIHPRLQVLIYLPPSTLVPSDEPTASIATLRQFYSDATSQLNDLTEVRPLIQAELSMKTLDGGQIISGLLDLATILDIVPEDFL